MANKASDHLHRLIRRMSKAEKRYFTLYTSRHAGDEETNYQVLFEAIDAQEEYDEEKLIRQLADRPLVRRFPIAKNRLYHAILRSLDAFHAASDIEARLYRQIHAAAILYRKSLYDQSLKLLESSRKTALRHELLPALEEISRWEKRILERSQYESLGNEEQLDQILEQDRDISERLETVNELWELKSRLFMRLYRNGKARSREEQDAFIGLVNDRLAELAPRVCGTEAQYLMHHIRSAGSFATGDYEACYRHLSENLRLLSSSPECFSGDPSVWLSVVTNAMHVAMRIGKRKDAFRLMDELRAFRDREEGEQHDDLRLRLFVIGMSAELSLLTQSREFEAGAALSERIAAGLKQYGHLVPAIRVGHFCFNLAVCQFAVGHYHEAQRWLQRLFHETPLDLTSDLHGMARILSLVVDLELGNTLLLPHALRSARRFLGTRRKIHAVEEAMLGFVHESLKKRHSPSHADRYDRLAELLGRLRNDPFERHAFEFFDFHAWALGKASGRAYRDVLAA
jgi:hypothetical protein